MGEVMRQNIVLSSGGHLVEETNQPLVLVQHIVERAVAFIILRHLF